MNKEAMIKELQSKLASIGRNIVFSQRELQDEEFLKDALGRFEYNFIPKAELQKFYEGAINSVHGYTLEDVESYKKHGIVTGSLNTYVAWSSFQDDIKQLGEASANFGVDYKEYMKKRYQKIQKTFVADERVKA